MAGSLRANELARAALDETALAGACVDLVSAHGTATVAGGLLATSFVVRKLALEPREPYSCSALDAYVRWPRSLGEMQTWLAAADFLLAEPPAAYVAFLLDAAARAHGLCSGQVLRCPLDPMAASGEGLEEHLRRWMLEARAPEADAYAPPAGAAARPDVPLLTTTPADLAPASRGEVRLANADPRAPAVIDPGYLTAPEDLEALIDGLEMARALGESAALAPWRAAELCPGPGVTSRAAMGDFIRRAANSFHHPVGTCAMGAVVDAGLRVRGIAGLRVVDASVMPAIPRSFIHAATIAVAEKAADLMLGL